MKHLTFEAKDKKKFSSAIKKANKNPYKSKLIQVFSASTDEKKIKKLLIKLKKKIPDAIIIGATTAGEISHAKTYKNSIIISISLFKKTKIKVSYVDATNKKTGNTLYKNITTKNTKAAIVFSEGLNGENYDDFIKSFQKNNTNIILAGGLAGDNFDLKKTLVFLNEKIYTKGSVGVSFSGKNLYADNRYNLNWSPIGKEFTITKADKNIIEKIDNQSSIKIFKKYLGNDIFDNKTLSNFQLLYKDGKTIVSRIPMAINKKGIIFAAPIKEGQKVQFGFSNASSVITESQNINNIISKNPAQAIYIYSCIARKTLLKENLEQEFINFESTAPTSGFFTYGEYYSTGNNNELLNCSTTLLILSESNKANKKAKNGHKNSVLNLDNSTFDSLIHFIKETTEELKINSQLLNQYKNAVDSSLLVSKTNCNGIITYVNDNFCKISQYTADELIGKNHNIIRDKDISSSLFKKMWDTIKSGKTWKGQFSNIAKNGSKYYVDTTIVPIFNKNNEIKEFIAIRQNITKLIQSQHRMKDKEKLIKAIFDNQDSIVIYASKTHGMLNVNKTLFDFLDYKDFEDFKEKNKCICDLFLEEEGYIYPKKHPNWMDDIAMDESDEYKVKILTKDNFIHTFNIKIKKINDEYIINLYDITNLENALLKAYSSEQAKSTFLANMSHEIRTPLNGILGFTDILSKKSLDKESKRYIDIINSSGKTLLHVVNDILDFSKIESGELSLNETESNLFTEMESTISTFASTAKKKQIDYFAFIDTDIPKSLKCDTQRLKQVLNNLVSNAIKFTPKNGKVSVNISLKSIYNNTAKIHFSIKDSGIGINEEKLATIFNPFSQADNSISREFGGTGLGLSISNQYITMMNSDLKVKSSIGKGSEFSFELTLPIINSSTNLNNDIDTNEIKIELFEPKAEITCGIYEVISHYLDSWKFHYNTIDNLENINEDTNILIVCSKLFDKDISQKILLKDRKLQIICIESGKDSLECNNKQLHKIEQPMTGSALFDKIITLTHNENYTPIEDTKSLEDKNTYEGNILIAEDNETNQMLISILMQSRNLEYRIVNNGREAIDEALRNDYNIIFMDINMPILDGLSATKILRKEHNYTKTIISLSANVIDLDIKKFIKAGVNDTLNKPIIATELDNILHKYLSKKDTKEKIITEFDEIDIDKISKAISISNKEIILKLLQSFKKSAQNLIEDIKAAHLNEHILHNIKGMSGNLRLNVLYELICKFEDEHHHWDEVQKSKSSKIVIAHLNNAIKKIKLLET